MIVSAATAAADRDGKGGKGGKGNCQSPCSDGSKPSCPDGSMPNRTSHPPTCTNGSMPLCRDGSVPKARGRKLQRGGRSRRNDEDDDDCKEGMAAWQIALVSVLEAGSYREVAAVAEMMRTM